MIGLGAFLVVVIVFLFGMFVGEQKARFSYRWGENYHRFFGGPRFGVGAPRGFFGGHGAFGEVIKKDSKTLVVRGPDNAEKAIILTDDTVVVKYRQKIKGQEIKIGDRIVVVGEPNKKGQIKARLIRVFDANLWKGSMWRRESSLGLPPPYLRL